MVFEPWVHGVSRVSVFELLKLDESAGLSGFLALFRSDSDSKLRVLSLASGAEYRTSLALSTAPSFCCVDSKQEAPAAPLGSVDSAVVQLFDGSGFTELFGEARRRMHYLLPDSGLVTFSLSSESTDVKVTALSPLATGDIVSAYISSDRGSSKSALLPFAGADISVGAHGAQIEYKGDRAPVSGLLTDTSNLMSAVAGRNLALPISGQFAEVKCDGMCVAVPVPEKLVPSAPSYSYLQEAVAYVVGEKTAENLFKLGLLLGDGEFVSSNRYVLGPELFRLLYGLGTDFRATCRGGRCIVPASGIYGSGGSGIALIDDKLYLPGACRMLKNCTISVGGCLEVSKYVKGIRVLTVPGADCITVAVKYSMMDIELYTVLEDGYSVAYGKYLSDAVFLVCECSEVGGHCRVLSVKGPVDVKLMEDGRLAVTVNGVLTVVRTADELFELLEDRLVAHNVNIIASGKTAVALPPAEHTSVIEVASLSPVSGLEYVAGKLSLNQYTV
jgi:hypothetical protein